VPDTYAQYGYRDQDIEMGTSICGLRMAAADIPPHAARCAACQGGKPVTRVQTACGKTMPSGKALGGHKAQCRQCRAVGTTAAVTSSIRDAQFLERPPPKATPATPTRSPKATPARRASRPRTPVGMPIQATIRAIDERIAALVDLRSRLAAFHAEQSAR
jgi:hypothetical protein